MQQQDTPQPPHTAILHSFALPTPAQGGALRGRNAAAVPSGRLCEYAGNSRPSPAPAALAYFFFAAALDDGPCTQKETAISTTAMEGSLAGGAILGHAACVRWVTLLFICFTCERFSEWRNSVSDSSLPVFVSLVPKMSSNCCTDESRRVEV